MELIWFLFFHYFSFFTNHLPASTSFSRFGSWRGGGVGVKGSLFARPYLNYRAFFLLREKEKAPL